MFQKAVRHDVKLRIGFAGPSGSGKTYSAIRVAKVLADASAPTRGPGSGRIAVIDTERDSAQLYAGEQTADGVLDFDAAVLTDYRPETFTRALEMAERAGYPVVVIDSLSHAWEGILELKDSKGSSFEAWKTVTPVHNRLVDKILRYPGHVIACLRVKTEYVIEDSVNKAGRSVKAPKKVGLAPVARSGMEYEFTVFGDLEPGTNTLSISKTRCSALNGRQWVQPGGDFARVLLDWISTADAQPAPTPEPAPAEPATEPAPRWTPAEGRAFFAALKAADVPHRYEDLAAWCESVRRPRPSAMTAQQRADLIAAVKPGGVAEGKLVDFVEQLAKAAE